MVALKTIEQLDNPIILPDIKAKLLYGIEPTVFTRADMANFYSWYKFSIKHDSTLSAVDFVDYDMYLKYFILSLGLLEYSAVFIGGPRGNGKSLFMAYMSRQSVRLFGKQIVFDKVPPKPELYGRFHCLYDEDFIEQIQDELNDLDKKDKALRISTGHGVPKAEIEKLIIYNAVFALDECDKWAERSSRTNLTKLISRLINRARHYYLCFFLSMIDPDRFDKLIYNKNTATHTVSCGFNWFPQTLPDYCSYTISDIRSNGTGIAKWLHLNPADFADYWDSHDTVGISHSVDVYLGGHKKIKKKEVE